MSHFFFFLRVLIKRTGKCIEWIQVQVTFLHESSITFKMLSIWSTDKAPVSTELGTGEGVGRPEVSGERSMEPEEIEPIFSFNLDFCNQINIMKNDNRKWKIQRRMTQITWLSLSHSIQRLSKEVSFLLKWKENKIETRVLS